MDIFKEKQNEAETPCKNTWRDWLINYIPDPIKNGGWC